ncbi:MAG: flavodoxin family protein [Thermoplasmata archaeon]|nr:MAG: flavodoxin family protein [Thermoplasmata archaeon]
MKILIVLGHPDPGSLNHAIAHAVRNDMEAAGHDVIFHDLYAERFDPLLIADEIPENGSVPLAVQAHCDDLCSADGIVIVHPNWWGQPPAILKGWIDRVFRPGLTYRFEEGDTGEGVPVGLLRAKTAVVLNTSNTEELREQTAFGDPLDAIWRRCIFDLCGVRSFHRKMFTVVVTSTHEQRIAWIEETKALCRSVFGEESHNRVAGGLNPPAPTPPLMRVRKGRFTESTGP